ncbi:unnamed protein product, partial [Polarella glacialis]
AATGRACTFIHIFDPRFIDRSAYGRVTDPSFRLSIAQRKPVHFGNRKCGAIRARFWIRCVQALAEELEALGSELVVLHGRPEEIFAEYQQHALVICQEEPVSPEQCDVESAVEKSLAAQGSILRREWGSMSLYRREDLPLADKPGSYSGLASALGFQDVWTSADLTADAKQVTRPRPRPKGPWPKAPFGKADFRTTGRWYISREVLREEAATLSALGFSNEELSAALTSSCPEGGEKVAQKQLEEWCRTAGNDTSVARMEASWDLPVAKGSRSQGPDVMEWKNLSEGVGWTQTSKHLALGCISPRQLFWRTRSVQKHPGVVHRLIWREWHRLNAIVWGRRLFWLQGPGRVERPWKQDPDIAQAWKDGRTGVPYIDACMRELKATGWLAYKGRKTAGAFLVHNLGFDWRIGAFWYEEVLMDYDCAMNYGNWTTIARVDRGYAGNDFTDVGHKDLKAKLRAEYANDPEGKYIRQWVPELQNVSKEFLHWPWLEKKAPEGYASSLVGELDPFECDECGIKRASGGTLDSKAGMWYCETCVAKWKCEQDQKKLLGNLRQKGCRFPGYTEQEKSGDCAECKELGVQGFVDRFDAQFYCSKCWQQAGFARSEQPARPCPAA